MEKTAAVCERVALPCPQAREGNPPTRSLRTGHQMAEREETLGRCDKERERAGEKLLGTDEAGRKEEEV